MKEHDGGDWREKSFLQRQATASSRRQEAEGVRARKETELRLKAEKAHLKAGDLKTFRQILTAKTGGVVAGWLALAGMDGRMGYQEFATMSRQLGFQGDTRVGWKELDRDNK